VTNLGMLSVIGLVCSSAVILFVLLGLGLCRAAAYAPQDVQEDDGSYE